MILSLWIGHDDCRTTTMGCVYRDWKPTHTVICLATSNRREWRVVWERGKPWTMYLDTPESLHNAESLPKRKDASDD